MVILRTGVSVPEVSLIPSLEVLGNLMDADRSGFYELVMLARDPKHKLSGGAEQEAKFRDMGFIESASPKGAPILCEDARNFIFASVEGESPNTMKLVNPLIDRSKLGGKKFEDRLGGCPRDLRLWLANYRK